MTQPRRRTGVAVHAASVTVQSEVCLAGAWAGSYKFGRLSAQNVRLVHPGKYVSGTVVLGYTLPYLVVRRRPALNVLEPQIVVC
jgi:hypothetical protein